MTNKQKQHLLGYLGYYSGTVDGIWGPLSRQAARQFQQDWNLETEEEFGTESQEKIVALIASGEDGNWWEKIRYFSREEFRCRCGGTYCGGFPAEPERALVELADQVREHFDSPAMVSSGLRCVRHNGICGGVTNSRHLSGKAMDFRIRGISGEKTLAYIRTLSGVRYAYAIDDAYVHMDIE